MDADAVLRPSLDPSPSSAEPPRIFLLAPQALGPKVACVEDALRARGYRVEVALGQRARRWVRNVPPGPPSLRVLCVAEIDPAKAERLRKGRDDFRIVSLETPLGVVQEVERLTGRARSRRPPRPSRMYLAQPTLIEQQLEAQRGWGWGLACVVLLTLGAGVGAVLVGGSGSTVAREPKVARESAVVRVPSKAPVTEGAAMRRREESVLSAVAPIDPDALDAVEDPRR